MFRLLQLTALLALLGLCAAARPLAMVEPASKIKFDDAITLPGTGSGLS